MTSTQAALGVVLGLAFGLGACEATHAPDEPASAATRQQVTAATDLGVAPSDPTEVATQCGSEGAEPVAAIASAPLDLTGPVRLRERVRLVGEGAPSLRTTQQNVTSGLRALDGRTYLIMDAGFWDISSAG